ncbi:MAG TPA: DUF6350 family protein [Nocardioidaceae bacterium]
MTDLLSPAARRTPSSDDRPAGRSPVLTASAAAAVAAGVTLLLAVAAALAGWFAADAGRYGDTRDAVRVGADAWLLAHGAGLRLDTATVTVLPLGLTLLCAYVAHRVGRAAARRTGLGSARGDLRGVLVGAGTQATVYALLAMGTALLAAHARAESDLLRALLGGFVLSLLAGGAGWLTGSGQAQVLVGGMPTGARSVLTGAVLSLLLLLAGSAFLVGGALVADFGTAATVLSRLHADGPGGLMYTLVGIAFVPNAVLLGTTYLLGSGFAVGTGTVVSPTAVVLGPVPAFPLLAALPGDGPTPSWTTALVAVPVLLTLGGVALASRRVPVVRVDAAALWGLAAGLLAALLLTGLVTLAGGSAGPGRMAQVGAPAASTLLAAAVSCGAGGLVGGALGAWGVRRRVARAAAVTSASQATAG